MKIDRRFIERISPQFWSILILESVFLLFTPQNNYLLIIIIMCISSCVRDLNMKVVLMGKYTFSFI